MKRTLPLSALCLVLSPLFLVTGCGKQSGPQAGPTASGEVLPGTVSDAMLDTDRTQAEAPLAPAAASASTKMARDTVSTASDPAAVTSAGERETAQPAELPAAPAAAPKPKPAASQKPPVV